MSYVSLYPPHGSRFHARAFVAGTDNEGDRSLFMQHMIAEAKDTMVLDALRQSMERVICKEHDRLSNTTTLSCSLICMTAEDYEAEIRRAYLCGLRDEKP